MAEMIEVKHKDRLNSEPARTSREAFDAVWEPKGFVEVGPDGQPQRPLAERTIPQLLAYAEAAGIDLPPEATKKGDILAAIDATAQEG